MRPTPNAAGLYKIIWPEVKYVPAETLIAWASDDVNNLHDTTDYRVSDVNEAIDILLDTGSVTFGKHPKAS